MLVDEYGAVAGLISIEDILEEIVGEISDEYDADEDLPIEDLGDGSFRVSSRLSLVELEELFNDQRYNGHSHGEHRDGNGDSHRGDSRRADSRRTDSRRADSRDGEEEREERAGEDSRWEDPDAAFRIGEEIEFSEEQHDEVDTVAGLGAFELGKVPMPGAEIQTAGLHLVFEGGHNKRGRYIVKSAVVRRVADEGVPADGEIAPENGDNGGSGNGRGNSAEDAAVSGTAAGVSSKDATSAES